MKKLILPALFMVMLSAQAQKKERIPLAYEKAVSFSPLMLLGPDYTLTGGYEKRISPNLVLASEAGIIMGSSYFSNMENSGRAWGILLRPSVKFFMDRDKNFYLQPQLFYKMVNNQLYDWLGKNCVDEVPAYEELQHFTLRRQAFGFNTIAGILVPNKSRKLLFDFYLGLGIRHKTVHVPGDEHSCYIPNGFGFGSFDQEGTFPNVAGGVRLLFVL